MSEKTPQTQQKEDVGGPSKGAASVKPEEKKKLPQLGALEDDDEFEDFPANAEQAGTFADAMAKNGSGPKDQLWEDNWDDDDVEDDFVNTLRTAIAQRSGADEPMKE